MLLISSILQKVARIEAIATKELTRLEAELRDTSMVWLKAAYVSLVISYWPIHAYKLNAVVLSASSKDQVQVLHFWSAYCCPNSPAMPPLCP